MISAKADKFLKQTEVQINGDIILLMAEAQKIGKALTDKSKSKDEQVHECLKSSLFTGICENMTDEEIMEYVKTARRVLRESDKFDSLMKGKTPTEEEIHKHSKMSAVRLAMEDMGFPQDLIDVIMEKDGEDIINKLDFGGDDNE